MKVAKLYYWCGLGLLLGAVVFVIIGFVSDEGFIPFVIGRTLFCLFAGIAYVSIGARKMGRARLEQFAKECSGCRFADERVLGKPIEEIVKNRGCCTRPTMPEVYKNKCLSREDIGQPHAEVAQ